MSNFNTTTTFVSIQTLEDRIRIEASRQQHDLRESYAAVSKLPNSRLARHAQLVNARLHVLAYDVIAFYSQRYGVTPVAAPYTHDQAMADMKVAGLSHADAQNIAHKAIRLNVKGCDYRAFVDAHVDMRKAELAADRAKNAAKLAEIMARQSVVA